MFFWLFAGTMAFAGSVAAQNTVSDYDPDNPWQGQDVTVDDNLINEDDEFTLREVTDTNDDGTEVTRSRSVRDVVAQEDDELTIETDDLDQGDYFIAGGPANFDRNPDLSNTFEVRIQDLDAEFDDEVVTDEGADSVTELDIDSNRARYDVNVSADGDLDDTELAGIHISLENTDAANGEIVPFPDAGDQAGTPGQIENVTLTEYVEDIVTVRQQVTFDDDDNVEIDRSTQIDASDIDALDNITDLNSVASDGSIGAADTADGVTFGNLVNPVDQDGDDLATVGDDVTDNDAANVNPFNAVIKRTHPVHDVAR